MRHNRLLNMAAALGIGLTALVGCSGDPSSEGTALVEEGKRLYAANCQSCHGDAPTGEGRIDSAPSHGPSGHTWHHADGLLEHIILGEFDYPGRTMPSFADSLSEEEVGAVIAYIKTGWSEEQRAAQEVASRNWEEQAR